MKNTISILGVAILSASVSFDVLAVSLNQAIDSQLARPEGGLPCQRLLDAGGRVTGQLEVICARQAPAGSVPAAAGGGAANPSLGFVTESDDRRHDEHEAQEESINGAWSWFASVETGSMNRSTSEYEDGFDSDNTGFLVGLGYRIQDNLFLNVGLESRNQEGDFLEYGDFSQDSTGLRLGLNYNFNDRAFLDFALISDDVSASRTRLAQFQDLSQSGAVLLSSEGVASTDYDFTRSGFSLNLGYDYSSGAWRVTTLLGLDSTSSDFGSYSETGLSGVEVTVCSLLVLGCIPALRRPDCLSGVRIQSSRNTSQFCSRCEQ